MYGVLKLHRIILRTLHQEIDQEAAASAGHVGFGNILHHVVADMHKLEHSFSVGRHLVESVGLKELVEVRIADFKFGIAVLVGGL